MGRPTRDDLKQQLHEAGLRATAPRIAVLMLLFEANKPLSHTEVVESLGSDDWDQATIYRNLVKLVEAGLARVASRVAGIARYQIKGNKDGPHQHPHFSCRSCGAVECLPEAKLTGGSSRWSRSLEGSELQLIGDCPDCLPH